jgi:hypothetical protein
MWWNTLAIKNLSEALVSRLNERNSIYDARVQKVLQSLSQEEIQIIKLVSKWPLESVWAFKETFTWQHMLAIPRMLEKDIIVLAGSTPSDGPVYRWTYLGHIVAKLIEKGLPRFDVKFETDSLSPQTVETREK